MLPIRASFAPVGSALPCVNRLGSTVQTSSVNHLGSFKRRSWLCSDAVPKVKGVAKGQLERRLYAIAPSPAQKALAALILRTKRLAVAAVPARVAGQAPDY